MALQFNVFTGTLDYTGTGSSGGTVTGAGTATQVAFWTSGSSIGSDPAFFWDNVNKRFGVGINSGLLARIHVQSLVGEGATLFQGDFYNDGSLAPSPAAVTGALLSGRRSRGTPTVPAAVQPGDQLFNIVASGDAGAGLFSGSRANIILAAGGAAAWNAGSHPTQIDFNTTLEGTTGVSGSPPRLRIAHDGTILVNSTGLIAGSRVVISGGALHVLAGNALRLQGGGAGFSSFVDPTHAANILYILPATQGPAGTMLTNVDGAGTLDWRQAPAGLPGEDGIDGDPGPPGVTGATGPQGATGNTGNTGATGAPGLHGMDGIDGDDGMAFPIPGVQGPQGIQGIQGIQGVQGLQGFMGIPGGDGLDGEEGMPMPGIPGPQGPTGLTGIQGVQGPPGMSDDGGGGADEWPSFFGIPTTLTGDPFPIYTKLAGRPGTANDTILSTGIQGTLIGSNQAEGILVLNASTNGVTGLNGLVPTVRINTNVTNAVGANPLSFLTVADGNLTLGSGTTMFGVEFGSFRGAGANWTWNASTVTTHGLFNFLPVLTSTGTVNMGSFTVFNFAPTFQTPLGIGSISSFIRIINNNFQTAHIGTGPVTFSEVNEVGSLPGLAAGDQITLRRCIFFADAGAFGGKQPTSIAVDVANQTSAAAFTLAAAVRSAITDAGNATKMFLQDTGGARSEFKGLFTRYHNDVTAGNGLTSVLGAPQLFAQIASVPDTTALTVPVTGSYRAALYVFTSSVGTGTGTVTGTLKWTDDSGTEKSAVTSNSASLADATSFAMEVIYFRALATSTVKYATTLTGTAGTSQYGVVVNVERLA